MISQMPAAPEGHSNETTEIIWLMMELDSMMT
jgi:hypothetical protein